ncbi:MAG TPA: GNAT family N-acetyltransferase [Rhodanobacteraceae bacterium]|nr:GNAT family N-acetyltransferase [Rhodanobacteraceae bacterium]
MHAFDIRYASLDDIDDLAPLFDAYRVFYRQTSDLVLARRFLLQRMNLRESVIFLARDADTTDALGFVQLYPGFSSVSAGRIWILNDLFVKPDARGHGIGRALMQRAREHGEATGVLRLTLSTAEDNHAAQQLYESEGWQRDGDRYYQLPISRSS